MNAFGIGSWSPCSGISEGKLSRLRRLCFHLSGGHLNFSVIEENFNIQLTKDEVTTITLDLRRWADMKDVEYDSHGLISIKSESEHTEKKLIRIVRDLFSTSIFQPCTPFCEVVLRIVVQCSRVLGIEHDAKVNFARSHIEQEFLTSSRKRRHCTFDDLPAAKISEKDSECEASDFQHQDSKPCVIKTDMHVSQFPRSTITSRIVRESRSVLPNRPSTHVAVAAADAVDATPQNWAATLDSRLDALRDSFPHVHSSVSSAFIRSFEIILSDQKIFRGPISAHMWTNTGGIRHWLRGPEVRPTRHHRQQRHAGLCTCLLACVGFPFERLNSASLLQAEEDLDLTRALVVRLSDPIFSDDATWIPRRVSVLQGPKLPHPVGGMAVAFNPALALAAADAGPGAKTSKKRKVSAPVVQAPADWSPAHQLQMILSKVLDRYLANARSDAGSGGASGNSDSKAGLEAAALADDEAEEIWQVMQLECGDGPCAEVMRWVEEARLGGRVVAAGLGVATIEDLLGEHGGDINSVADVLSEILGGDPLPPQPPSPAARDLLSEVAATVSTRVGRLWERCVMCDGPLEGGPRHIRRVCARDLCLYQAGNLPAPAPPLPFPTAAASSKHPRPAGGTTTATRESSSERNSVRWWRA